MNLDPDPDIVEVILRACLGAGLDAAAARAVEEKIRAQYGGLRVRIPKRKKHATSEARDQVYSDGLTTMTTGEITQKHGISRATLYRVMKNRAG